MEDRTIDLGDYQVLADMRMPECSLRILRLTPGKAVRLHVHHMTTQVYFVIEGDAIANIDSESKKLGPYESLRVPVNTPHAISTETTAIVLSISLPPLRADDLTIV